MVLRPWTSQSILPLLFFSSSQCHRGDSALCCVSIPTCTHEIDLHRYLSSVVRKLYCIKDRYYVQPCDKYSRLHYSCRRRHVPRRYHPSECTRAPPRGGHRSRPHPCRGPRRPERLQSIRTSAAISKAAVVMEAATFRPSISRRDRSTPRGIKTAWKTRQRI